MASKVIGTVYQTPNNSGQFASGRGAIYSVAYSAPTIITMNGGAISLTLQSRELKVKRRIKMSNIYDLLSPDEKQDYIRVRQATRQGYILCENNGVADLSYPNSKLRRGRVQRGGADMSYTYYGELQYIQD